jgi:lysylphosphatidylglycerol synthetase-like protein (DUF2156 family)
LVGIEAFSLGFVPQPNLQAQRKLTALKQTLARLLPSKIENDIY